MNENIKITSSKTTELLLFIICLVITAGITLVYIEIHDHNMINRNRFSYVLNKDFENNSVDTAIASDIDNGKPILNNHGGRWTDRQLSDYLGFFELMQDYMDAGSLNKRDVYDNFSYDILNAFNLPEIKKYILQYRANTKDNSWWNKFEKLANEFDAIEKIKN